MIRLDKKYYRLYGHIERASGSEIDIDDWFVTKDELEDERDRYERDYRDSPRTKKMTIEDEEVSLGEMFNRLTVSEVMELDEEIKKMIEANTL
ncbi:hypothetical protein [Priestia megaterium]|uniref:hypothetical protein n=1 Tax=Priestia megaterium TaxID=1404 RepID=UPI002FFF4949